VLAVIQDRVACVEALGVVFSALFVGFDVVEQRS
jgi:hypothetical protein